MKEKDRRKEWMAALLIALSLWNLFYPGFTLTKDVYRETGEETRDTQETERVYEESMNAREGEVESRMGFLEWLRDKKEENRVNGGSYDRQ